MSENQKSGKFIWGIILVCIGCFLILSNLGVVPSLGKMIGLFWPLIMIVLGLIFHLGYYNNRKNVGLLVPGGILLTIGIICQTSMLWNLWDVLWPGFILAPAIGLFELYIFGKQEKGLMVPIGTLGTIWAICQAATLWNLWGFLWPGFILAPAVGLFGLYLFGDQEKALLIPVVILSGISFIFFSMSYHRLDSIPRYLIPVMLIIIGCIVLSKNKTQRNSYEEQDGFNEYDHHDPL